MFAELAVYARLSGYAGVSSLVGSRIYPLFMPQNSALPAITYYRVGVDPVTAAAADPALEQARIQVDSWGENYNDAKALAEQVRAALKRWEGTAGGVQVKDVFLESEIDYFESENQLNYYRVVQDFIVWVVPLGG